MGCDAETGSVEDVSVDHGGADVFVAEEFLHGANVVAVLQQMRSEAVTEGVAAGGFVSAGGAHGDFDGVLEVFLEEVMTAGCAASRIDAELCGREDPLARPMNGRR